MLLLAVSEKPFQQAVEYARSRGTIVAIGLPAHAFLKAPVFETVVKMVTIKGSYVGNRQDGVEAIDFYARGLIKAPFKTVPLKELPEVFKLMGTFQMFRLLDIDHMLIGAIQSKARSPVATSSRFLSRCIVYLCIESERRYPEEKLLLRNEEETKKKRKRRIDVDSDDSFSPGVRVISDN